MFGWKRPINCLKLNMHREQAISRCMTLPFYQCNWMQNLLCRTEVYWLVMCRTKWWNKAYRRLPMYSRYYAKNTMELYEMYALHKCCVLYIQAYVHCCTRNQIQTQTRNGENGSTLKTSLEGTWSFTSRPTPIRKQHADGRTRTKTTGKNPLGYWWLRVWI